MAVSGVEPIVESDDEIEHALAAGRAPAAARRARVRHRRSLVAPRRAAPRPDAHRAAAGRAERGAAGDRARARARRHSMRFRDDGGRPAPPPSDDRAGADHGVRRRRHPTWPSTCRCSRRSSRCSGEDRRGPSWHKADIAPDTEFRVVIIGAGMSGLLAAHRLAAGRRRLRRPREERRRRRDLVREQLSGLPRRQPEPQLQLLLRAAPRLAVPLLVAGRVARLLPALRGRLRPARPHPVRHRGAVGDVVRAGRALDDPRSRRGRLRGRRSRRTR